MFIHSLFFYFFSLIAIFAAIMVIFSRNTVHSVFFLILDFITIACLFIMIGAEFLGMIMLIVYVGAVAVLFLFVVMMLNINLSRIKGSFSENLPIGGLISFIVLLELFIVIGGKKINNNQFIDPTLVNFDSKISNTEMIGNILYTDNIQLFQISGMILLISMVGAIVLTYRKREGVKRQNVFSQISREKISSVSLVNPENEKGVKIDD